MLQLRRAGLIALAAWPSFAILDWFIVEFVQAGRLGLYLALRVLGLVLLGIAVAVLHAPRTPSKRMLVAIETFVFTALAALISVQCVEFRGITSPLALGVVLVLLFRSATLGDHWRRSIVPIVATSLAYPLVLVALSQWSPLIASQFGDPTLVAGFALNVSFIFAAGAITLVGGHSVWLLRTQVSQTRSLGRYQLKELIGQGGMGEVWSAYHVALKRNVAVKILRPDAGSDDMVVARFEREARATAELNHPNTVRVYDYGVTEDGLWYYAMELLQGEDLGALVKRGGVEAMRAADLLCQASRALAEAHKRGIVHRDIKPANLFLCTLGGDADFVKVLDFGLAKLAENAASTQITQTGMAVGTPSYVSPEVVLGHAADARSDVYALGSVLYALIAGKPPFTGEDMRAVLMAHLRDAPELPSHVLGRSIPRPIEAVIMRCLEKEPDDRYPDAGALAEALHRAMNDVLTGATSSRRHRRLRTSNPIEVTGHAARPPARRVPRGSIVPFPVPEAPTFLGEADWDGWDEEAGPPTFDDEWTAAAGRETNPGQD